MPSFKSLLQILPLWLTQHSLVIKMSFFFQMAESKMLMHQEMITKDEEIGKLRTNLKKASEESSKLKEEIEALKKAQVRF